MNKSLSIDAYIDATFSFSMSVSKRDTRWDWLSYDLSIVSINFLNALSQLTRVGRGSSIRKHIGSRTTLIEFVFHENEDTQII